MGRDALSNIPWHLTLELPGLTHYKVIIIIMRDSYPETRNFIFADKKNKNFYKIAVVSLLLLFILLIVFSEFIIPDTYTAQLSKFQCQQSDGTL